MPPRRIAIIQGHPTAGGGHFCHALADAYAQANQTAAEKQIAVLRTQQQGAKAQLEQAQATLTQARTNLTRARITAIGELFTCLFGVKGRDLRAPLRAGASDQELIALLRGVWTRRTDRYSELRTAKTAALPKVEMSYIGG